ncbi:hypothetical protein JTB14_000047 [Gonioctena quinquepunctata]|nr:hypothetical protein JTB14_000047 [Gonioctena quinquepunctata]
MMEEDLSYTIRNIHQQLSANKTASCYKFLKDELQEQWKPVQQLHHESMANAPNIEKHYLKSHRALKIQNNQSIPPNSLPQMQFPIFSGSYEEWPTFSDLFPKVVHQNQSISKTGKLQYLKSQLRAIRKI